MELQKSSTEIHTNTGLRPYSTQDSTKVTSIARSQDSTACRPLNLTKKLSFSKVVNRVSPSVVSVYASNTTDQPHDPGDVTLDMFTQGNMLSGRSVGSGILVSSDGLVITNAHVIERRNKITVVLLNGNRYSASILTINSKLDLALMQIQNLGNLKLPYLSLPSDREQEGHSGSSEVGDVVLTLGNPFGIGQTVTLGIISGFRYFEEDAKLAFSKLIQIDAAINPGNSGGAVVDTTGKLVGITSMIYSYNNQAQSGISFAIPAQVVTLFIKRYLNSTNLKKFWIGVKGVTVDSDLAYQLKLTYPKGAFIDQVTPKSPAEKAGLMHGDVIISFDHMTIDTISDLTFAVADLDKSKSVAVEYIRDGKKLTTSLTPTIPAETPRMDMIELSGPLAGVQFVNNSPFVSYQINTVGSEHGVVIYSINDNALFKKLGLRVGDFLLQVEEVKIHNTEDLKTYFKHQRIKKSLTMIVRREGEIIHITISGDRLFSNPKA